MSVICDLCVEVSDVKRINACFQFDGLLFGQINSRAYANSHMGMVLTQQTLRYRTSGEGYCLSFIPMEV